MILKAGDLVVKQGFYHCACTHQIICKKNEKLPQCSKCHNGRYFLGQEINDSGMLKIMQKYIRFTQPKRIHYTDKIIYFLDILGFREKITKTIDINNNEISSEVDGLYLSLNHIHAIYKIREKSVFKTKKVTNFSDSFIVTFSTKEFFEVFKIIIELRTIIVSLFLDGILVRGSLTTGKAIHTDKIVFGPGIIKAIDLEKKNAIYPRVIIDKEIVKAMKIVKKEIAFTDSSMYKLAKDSIQYVKKDKDGFYYVDYLTYESKIYKSKDLYKICLKKIKEAIESGIKSPDENIRIKYQWVKEKLKIR